MRVICVTESKYTSLSATKTSYSAYLPALIVAVGIAVVSLIEQPDRMMVIRASDKVLHGVLYAVWTVTLIAGAIYDGYRRWTAYASVLGIVALYGGLIEVLQACCTQTRSGDWVDWVADIMGAIAGLIVVYLVLRIARRYDR